jgi:two-component system sensor histidine kinase AlgZ
MKESQILSSFGAKPPSPELNPAAARRIMVFDACHPGLVFKALLLVQAASGVVALFEAEQFDQWINQLGLMTCATLPATLAWLVAVCLLKCRLQQWREPAQYVFGSLLGGLCGLYGCGLLSLIRVTERNPWLGSAGAGTLVGGLLVMALLMRSKAHTPAATTARLSELQSRIRPHFLFNTLNSAISLVRAEPARAEALLEDLSDLFRHALKDLCQSSTLGEELLLAKRYLSIEQIRFGERLKIEWVLDPRAGPARLPPLILQPLLENAVKHGVEPCADGARVRVQTERRGQRVRIAISNTLGARSADAKRKSRGHGIALANVRDRLRLLHDVEVDFRAGARAGYYHVLITLPT